MCHQYNHPWTTLFGHKTLSVRRLHACRVWKGLLLAAFFNMQSNLYYELFSNFMGKGDKESFAHALRAARLHYHLLETPVGSVGITK